MTTAAYTFELDLDRDGTYGHALADVTGRWMACQWSNGLGNSYDEVARPARLRLFLDNHDGALSLDNSGGAYYGLLKKGLLLRVQATYGSIYTLYIGKVRDIQEAPGAVGERATVIVAECPMLDLLDAEWMPSLMTDVTADEALDAIFEGTRFAYPYHSSYWILGVVGCSELGTTTTLLDPSAFTNFETGAEVLGYVGDNSDDGEGVSAQGFIRNIVAGELGGRFWWDTRTAKFVFHNRQHDLLNRTVMAALTADEIESNPPPRISYADNLTNRVTLHYEPRETGAEGSIVWSSSEVPFTLAPGDNKVLAAKYRDPDNEGESIGAMTVIPPMRYVDVTATDADGEDRTGDLAVSIKEGGQSALVSIKNASDATVLTVTFLQLRATPITHYERANVFAQDGDSIRDNDMHEQSIYNRLICREERAQSWAKTLVTRFKDPLTRFSHITICANKSADLMAHALQRTVGDHITVAESWSGHSREYVVVGEAHQVSVGPPDGEHLHLTTWTLKPATRERGWLLGVVGYSELGETTWLAL